MRHFHGQSKSRLYGVWRTMKSRCFNPNNKKYKNYGGRGITVYDEWANDFQAFSIWAMANGYQEGLSIDRIDNDRGYYPDNCRFTDMKTQCNNMRRTPRIVVNGVQYTAKELSEATGIGYRTILKRYRAGLNGSELIKGANI